MALGYYVCQHPHLEAKVGGLVILNDQLEVALLEVVLSPALGQLLLAKEIVVPHRSSHPYQVVTPLVTEDPRP